MDSSTSSMGALMPACGCGGHARAAAGSSVRSMPTHQLMSPKLPSMSTRDRPDSRNRAARACSRCSLSLLSVSRRYFPAAIIPCARCALIVSHDERRHGVDQAPKGLIHTPSRLKRSVIGAIATSCSISITPIARARAPRAPGSVAAAPGLAQRASRRAISRFHAAPAAPGCSPAPPRRRAGCP